MKIQLLTFDQIRAKKKISKKNHLNFLIRPPSLILRQDTKIISNGIVLSLATQNIWQKKKSSLTFWILKFCLIHGGFS